MRFSAQPLHAAAWHLRHVLLFFFFFFFFFFFLFLVFGVRAATVRITIVSDCSIAHNGDATVTFEISRRVI